MLTVGSELQNRYFIIREVRRGGMGAVFEAEDRRLHRPAAVKVSTADSEETLRAFEREARLLASLRHPALPNVSDYFIEGGRRCLVMDFIGGEDLGEILRKSGRPFPARQALGWAEQLLDALAYLHGRLPPVIHRDIKPANLKLNPSGGVMLLDFGLAKGYAGAGSTQTDGRSLFGFSPNYASLEQMQGESSTPRSDLYSLAATLYHLATGVRPPDALKRVSCVYADEPDPLVPVGSICPELPAALAAVIMSGLELKPAHRPAGAAEMRELLLHVGAASVPGGTDLRGAEAAERGPTAPRKQIVIPVVAAQGGERETPDERRPLLSRLADRLAGWLSEGGDPPARSDPAESGLGRDARVEKERARAEQKRLSRGLTAEGRVAEFMREHGASEPDDGQGPSRHAAARSAGGKGDADDVAEMVRDVAAIHAGSREPEWGAAERRARERGKREARRLEKAATVLSNYQLPLTELMDAPAARGEQSDEELRATATRLAETLRTFNVTGKIEYICPGPLFTTYEFNPDPGVKYSRIAGLIDDLCLALKAESIRIDRVPGKAHVGIEVPNSHRDNIMMREVVESRQFQETASKLTLALGKTIDGLNYVADLAKMPHLLIAGATGTGKSVCLNSLVVSILYKARPDEVKFIMIDPKRLELGLYADIPHLATPIITEPKRAANALKWGVSQMEARYKQLAQWGVRNIDGYNTEVMRRNLVEDFDAAGQPWKPLPYIVIVVDEFSELTRSVPADFEGAVARLTEGGHSAGVHLIVTAQRPHADEVARAVKKMFPCRIAFRVTTKADSREALGAEGAERLLGRGDMLFLPPDNSPLVRVHGAYVDEAEIGRVVAHIKAQGEPVYDETIVLSEGEMAEELGAERDELFEQALRICVEMKRASTSVLQRRLAIGYGRAAAILDAMEREGFIGQADGARPRPVLGKGFETVSHWEALERREP